MCAALFVPAPLSAAQEDEECLFCHAEAGLTKETPDGKVKSLYVDADVFANSLHGENGCTSCHVEMTE